jgi:hypothetical protein
MHGTRDAAMNWATEYGETLKKAGFVQGKSSPCLFFNRSLDVTIMVHGDDFVAIGNPKHLQATEDALRSKYKIKTETLGGCAGDKKEVKILNKIVRYTDNSLELEADPRHAELIVRELGLEGCRPSKTPGSKAVAEQRKSSSQAVMRQRQRGSWRPLRPRGSLLTTTSARTVGVAAVMAVYGGEFTNRGVRFSRQVGFRDRRADQARA